MTNSKKSNNELGTGIYADVQNLQEISRDVLITLVKRWPDDMPKPTRLNLYVRADHQHLWRVWATHQFNEMTVSVTGVQHYSLSATKNAADLAIAVDAMSDLLHKSISHVAVVSDDSDFIALFAKLGEEAERDPDSNGRVPFLWVFTDRMDTKSMLLEEFFPRDYIHVVDLSKPLNEEPESENEPQSGDQNGSNPGEDEKDEPAPVAERPEPMSRADLSEQIALQLIREMPVGKFKSTDCQMTIHTKFPAHPLAKADGPAFGQLFRRDILPLLQRRGVRELGNQRPRQYEMTHEAKRALTRG
ncbi:MAG TPA: NYN domain-containing protein [Dehalococcoidia bacterium]|nr:NYN domain-containing protein [Dehalococcoidia bacterium]